MNAKAYVKPLIITVLGPTLVDGTSVRSTAALAAAARAGYLRASHVRLDTLSSVRISGGAAFGRLRRAVCVCLRREARDGWQHAAPRKMTSRHSEKMENPASACAGICAAGGPPSRICVWELCACIDHTWGMLKYISLVTWL